MQEFYSKAQSVYEEYQRREERFLETKNKWKSSKLKKDLETEEYLRRIEQKEKETKEAYRDVMNRIDDFDRRADLFLLELNQLENAQTSLLSHTDIAASAGLETNLLSYSAVENLIPKSTVPHSTLESLTRSSKFESTQTENAYCEKCTSLNSSTLKHFLPGHQIYSEKQDERTVMGLSKLHIDSESLFTKESLVGTANPLSNTNTTSEKVGAPNIMNSSTSQNDPDSSLTQNLSSFQPISSSKNVTLQENPKKYTENNSEKHFFSNNVSTNDNRYLNTNKEDTQNSLRDEVIPDNNTTDSNQENVSRVKNVPLKLQTSEHDSTETKLEDSEINVEAFTSKSDAESVNNEFDFLESDTKNAVSKKKTQKNSKKIASLSDKSNIKTDKGGESGLMHKRFGKPDVPSAKTFEDDKSETSESVSGPQSPTISLASDSESNHGKGSPSTAYQKLLRNTVIPKNTKANTMESDSEDEVEKALASTAQRTNLEPKISVSEEKDEPVLQPESKPQTKESSTSKLSKLSKNTRKVLGMDSSSGSEIELAIKPPNKNDDDDDEFDSFFN